MGISGVSGIQKIIQSVSPAASGSVLLGLGIAANNPEMIAMGASNIALVGVAALARSGAISAQAAGGLGMAVPGAAILGAGIARGGVAGGLEDLAGGTLAGAGIGFMIGGPAGAAVGAVVGAISGAAIGIVNGIFGGGARSFEQQVQHDMRNQAYYAPPSENFSFAENGSIANTLQTGFQQNGSTFSTYQLPSNTPFYASAITGRLSYKQMWLLQQQSRGLNSGAPFLGFPSNDPFVPGPGNPFNNHFSPAPVIVHLNLPGLIDASSAGESLAPIARMLAQHVSKQFASVSSGMAARSRGSVFLP